MQLITAIITDAGGRTSHTSILAQAFAIPAVVGLEHVTEAVGTGDLGVVIQRARGAITVVNTSDRSLLGEIKIGRAHV